MINMIAMLEVAHGIKPIKVIQIPDNSRPSGMNFFGLGDPTTQPSKFRQTIGQTCAGTDDTEFRLVIHTRFNQTLLREVKVTAHQVIRGITEKIPMNTCQRSRLYVGSI